MSATEIRPAVVKEELTTAPLLRGAAQAAQTLTTALEFANEQREHWLSRAVPLRCAMMTIIGELKCGETERALAAAVKALAADTAADEEREQRRQAELREILG